MRRPLLVTAFLLIVVLVVAAPAAGAPRVGSVDDPAGDAPVAPPLADAVRLAVSYEPTDGTLEVTLQLHEPLGVSPAPSVSMWADVGFRLGVRDGEGVCAPEQDGDLVVGTRSDSVYPPEAPHDFFGTRVALVGGPFIAGTDGGFGADRRTIRWTVGPDARLAGRDYRCVNVPLMNAHPNASDLLDPFMLDGPELPAPTGPEPPGIAAGPPAIAAVAPSVAAVGGDSVMRPRIRSLSGRLPMRTLTASVACGGPCVVSARLLVRPAVARALGIPRVVGVARSASRPGGSAGTRIVLTRAARRALAGRARLRVRLEVVVTGADGVARTLGRESVLTRR